MGFPNVSSAIDPDEKSRINPLGMAISEFLDELREKQKDDKHNPFFGMLEANSRSVATQSNPLEDEVAVKDLQDFVANLVSRKRTGVGYRYLEKLGSFLDILKMLVKRVETFAQVSPFGVGVAFMGARIVLEMACSVNEYFEVVVTAMDRIGGILKIYQKMPSLPDLQPRMVNSYKKIVKFWYQLSKVLSSKWKGLFVRSVLTSLKSETEDALKDMQEDMQINLGNSQVEVFAWTQAYQQARAEAEAEAERRNQRYDIIQWLLGQESYNFQENYRDQLEHRCEGTGEWMFEDQRFINWSDWRSAGQNTLLWFTAQAGLGKSVLASMAIDYLEKKGKKVAYFFYSFHEPSRRRVCNGLRSLAVQLLAFTEQVSDKLADIYQTERQYGQYLRNDHTLIDVVHELLNRIEDVSVVLDGIDECVDESDKCRFLEDLIQRPTLGTTRWWISSRATEIRRAMKLLKAVEMVPDAAEISRDIQTYLSKKLGCQHCLRRWTEQCETSFLYAKFVRNALEKLTSHEDIEVELKSFPSRLNQYYIRVLERISTRSNTEQELARRIFLILAEAKQSLTVDELVDALAIRRDSEDYKLSRVPEEELIVDLCGSLVTIKIFPAESGRKPTVSFCHKTIADFFAQDPNTLGFSVQAGLHKYFFTPNAANQELGMDCLTYLSYFRYSKPIDLKFLKADVPKEHAFLRYAATFWFQHLDINSPETSPSPEVASAVQKFLKSKNFWNCVRIQSQEVPYLFGRFHTCSSHSSSFQMAIRGAQWKGEDGFGLPLPNWLSDISAKGLELDQSFCSFADEWREVLITRPTSLDYCMPLKPFDESCYLKPPTESKKVWVNHLTQTCKGADPYRVRLLRTYLSKQKLCVDVLYRKRKSDTSELWRMQQPLFVKQCNSKPQQLEFPLDLGDQEWEICATQQGDTDSELHAWSIDPYTLDVRSTTQLHSRRFGSPRSLRDSASKCPQPWEIQSRKIEYHSGDGAPILIFHMTKRQCKIEQDMKRENDGESSDSEGSETSESDKDDDYSDEECSDDGSGADQSETESSSEVQSDDSEDESTSTEKEDVDCLILIQQNGIPYWTTPWTHSPTPWSRMVPAMHPSLPLLACFHSMDTIELIPLDNSGSEKALNMPKLISHQDTPLARVHELRFSSCGTFLHLLLIAFFSKNFGTECQVAVTTFQFNQETLAGGPLQHISDLKSCVYKFAYHLDEISPPYTLTSWADQYVLVALPPLTCDPKIMKISLMNNNTQNSILTLREPIYFPTSTPYRDAHLLHKPARKDSDGYLFLVLNAAVTATEKNRAVAAENKPLTALRWKASDVDDWRPWSFDEDSESSDFAKGLHTWEIMRGSFAESGKSFTVPIRSGLNWTRKAFLSCA
ncbi:hypothetical protein F5Y19DRAFT_432116 [Xylariaceae sp. FL1651]|nr:hypothetical protein F5Y19DRAFT_432116 [Xylariaceae sp. FL1651]